MKFTELGLTPKIDEKTLMLGDLELHIKKYLPVDDKANFIQFIVDSSLDDNTGCFSPLRVEVYFSIALCRWYAGIEFDIEDLTHVSTVYDTLETNDITRAIIHSIPDEELEFLQELVQETIADISRYNSSAAGIIKTASLDANGLDNQITDLLEKIKNGEGLETLDAIKNVVGTD